MKVTIELDLTNAWHLQIFNQFHSQVQSQPAQSLGSNVVEFPRKAQASEAVTAYIETGKAVNQAANDLADRIPNHSGKMSTKERASVAAKARWARVKAQQEGRPIPPKAPRRKNVHDMSDYSKAEQHDLSSFEEQPGEELTIDRVLGAQPMPFPDGRELLDGSWKKRFPAEREAAPDDEPEDPVELEDEAEDLSDVEEYARAKELAGNE